MTMQAKIWAAHFTGSKTEGKFSIYNLNAYGPHTTYIRADLAEELARALEHIQAMLDKGHDKMAYNITRQAIENYHAATK